MLFSNKLTLEDLVYILITSKILITKSSLKIKSIIKAHKKYFITHSENYSSYKIIEYFDHLFIKPILPKVALILCWMFVILYQYNIYEKISSSDKIKTFNLFKDIDMVENDEISNINQLKIVLNEFPIIRNSKNKVIKNEEIENDSIISYYSLFNRLYSQMSIIIPGNNIKSLLLKISYILYPSNFITRNYYITNTDKEINNILIEFQLMLYIDSLDHALINKTVDKDIENFDDYQEDEDFKDWNSYLININK